MFIFLDTLNCTQNKLIITKRIDELFGHNYFYGNLISKLNSYFQNEYEIWNLLIPIMTGYIKPQRILGETAENMKKA